ncbi:MAG: enoyl-CoA hydratase-related protein [Firmicutes bacterium]|jgi:enoyl-CoA hydratase|nr:enoyl-CoA hydratase-related protein [Bacillota bacterium]
MDYVKVERRDGVAVITIDRQPALNALNWQVLDELSDALDAVASDAETRVVVITGAGDRAFVAGADIEAMQPMSVPEAREWAVLGQRIFSKIESLPQPVIAAINGYALGGGCELALACDIRIASDRAKLGQPEVTLGITTGFGGSQRLPRVVGPGWARQMILSGDVLDAATAERIGLVNAVVPAAELMAEAMKLAAKIASRGAVAVRLAKRALNVSMDADLETGLRFEAEVFGECFGTPDQKEGMKAFLEKRKPVFTGKW